MRLRHVDIPIAGTIGGAADDTFGFPSHLGGHHVSFVFGGDVAHETLEGVVGVGLAALGGAEDAAVGVKFGFVVGDARADVGFGQEEPAVADAAFVVVDLVLINEKKNQGQMVKFDEKGSF